MSAENDYFRDPGSGDGVKKLLDNGHIVVLFKSPLGTYTAAALNEYEHEATGMAIFDAVGDMPDWGRGYTDHPEPTKALALLTDKVLGCGPYAEWPPKRFRDMEETE